MLSPLWRRQALPAPLDADDWADLLGQARSSLLGARLALWLQAHGGLEAVPERPRSYLRLALDIAQRHHGLARQEMLRMRAALRRIDGPVLVLKGGAYLATGLPAAAGRTLSDIDLLVPRDQLDEAESALLAGGWIAQERDAYNQRYYRQWMHEIPPLTHVQRGTVIDLHHTITAPTSSFAVDGAALIAASRAVDATDPRWRVLQPVDMVLHSAVHLFQEGEFDHGLRDLLDMDWLLQHFETREPDFWPQLLARAAGLRLQVPLHHALHHIERLFGPRVPAGQRAAVVALAPAWPQRTLMACLLERALRPMHPSAAQGGDGLARSLLYLRSHWLRMPMHLLLPHLLRKAWMRHFPDDEGDQPAVRG
ncbi:nucleotidyltransferase domain-containing protein [Aquabacterium sp. OR-4]|uniref:nucleotidyltransferase domain-containing protein n=1 Tax=Aquabacterium sp. OR-4 TaxID=2978127 RepID=UPI0021B3BEBD|nr:nucleotidyltransferase family protein [Aquabacterium sp. OR-4]MDT7836202.1 nucleotidyltransferase family protein [Aquabacterium sp. OR-4]